MILYRSTFVVAKSQHRPLLFWSVTGPVLKSITLLKMCWSVIPAERDVNADRRSEWVRMVLASWALGSPATSASQDDTLSNVSLPLFESGAVMCSRDNEVSTSSSILAFSSTWSVDARVGVGILEEGVLPMVVVGMESVFLGRSSGDMLERVYRALPLFGLIRL